MREKIAFWKRAISLSLIYPACRCSFVIIFFRGACHTFKFTDPFWVVTTVLQDLYTTSKWCDVGLRCLYSTLPVALMDTTKLFIVFPLYSICKLALSYADMFYNKVWICDVIFMTCGLFLILHHVLCVLAIDPGTSTVSTETSILTGSGRYWWYQSPCWLLVVTLENG